MATIYCMNCGAPLREGVMYCDACGSPTLLGAGLVDLDSKAQVACPFCGELNDAGEQFCASCGKAIPQEPASLEETARAAVLHNTERRSQHRSRRTTSAGMLAGLALVCVAVAMVVGIAFATGVLGTAPAHKVVETEEPEEVEEKQEVSDTVVEEAPVGAEVREGLAAYSWSELSAIGRQISAATSRNDALDIARDYNLVDGQGHMLPTTKDVQIEGLGTVSMRLADVYHDDRSDGEGKAGLSLVASGIAFSHRMGASADNAGGWEASEMRSWLSSDVLGALDGELAPLIVAVDKHTNNAGQTNQTSAVTSTSDQLWVPSLVEVVGNVSRNWYADPANSNAFNAIFNAEGSQYACFADAGVTSASASSALALKGASGASTWWLRTPSTANNSTFRMVDGGGDAFSWGDTASDAGVCLGFCL